MEPRSKAFLASPFSSLLIFFLIIISLCGVKASSSGEEEHSVKPHEGPVVEKDQRTKLHVTEYGEISATEVKEAHRAPPYHLEFFTLEPNSVFLPVLLHAAMVFYVQTGIPFEFPCSNYAISIVITLRILISWSISEV